MRLTLTGLASQYVHMPLAPFCLKKAVEEQLSVPVTICDININEPVEDSLARLLQGNPTHIGFSVYIWNREMTARLVRRIKALDPDICILLGGPEVSFSPENTLAEMPCDYLLRGAGEESLPALLRCLMEGRQPSAIPGVCWQGHIVDPAPTPPPRSDLYDDAWHTALNGRMVYVETSRGCPFSCAFCLSGQKDRVQFMPQEEALALLIRLGASGTDTVKLIDRTFNCDRARTKFLLGGLMQAKAEGKIGEVCYHLEVTADLFDDETLDLLAKAPAGLFQMEAGLQSFHAPTLDACRRRTDMHRLVDRLQRILAPGNVHLHIDLIAGLPEEDFATFGQSFDCAYELHPHQLQLGFLKFIHGSHLRETSWGQRFAPDPPYEVLSTPWISYAELRRLHGCAEAVERIHNSGRFADTLHLALAATGMRPFDLFLRLGDAMAARQGRWSLDALTAMIHETLLALGVPADDLRDAMIRDRLATDNTGYLPPLLQSDPEALKRAARLYRDAHPQYRHPRCALISNGRLLAAVWTQKHPVTQRGEVQELSVAELISAP
ncbi:MAG: DUF4080 domain-containing protein [Clostridia bacterium]|nr:DUF4080 domain-containing protein [Clostridia bacterium]